MKTLMVLTLGAALMLPGPFVFAQDMSTSTGRSLVSWDQYSFDRRNELVGVLKGKIKDVDERINQIKKSTDTDEVKRQETESEKNKKHQLESQIKQINSATAENWDAVRNDISATYKSTNW